MKTLSDQRSCMTENFFSPRLERKELSIQNPVASENILQEGRENKDISDEGKPREFVTITLTPKVWQKEIS